MSGAKRIAIAGACLVALVTAACDRAVAANEVQYSPPPPMALVALLDPSPDRLPAELRQLASIVRANATPDEAVVAMLLEPSFGSIYTVQQGDSLSKIAAAHGLSLTQIEAANPQLGPLSGRDYKLIHPGERVMLPDGASSGALLLATRAPSGPPHPMLIKLLPTPPSSATDFQRAQYKRTVESDNAANATRIATWQASAAQAVQGWQQDVATQLEAGAAALPVAPRPNQTIVAASINAALATLSGLGGRHVLLLLGGGDTVPAQLPSQSLSGINFIVANVTNAQATAQWTARATGAGAASVDALDTALTQLQLPQVVNHHVEGGT